MQSHQMAGEEVASHEAGVHEAEDVMPRGEECYATRSGMSCPEAGAHEAHAEEAHETHEAGAEGTSNRHEALERALDGGRCERIEPL